MGHKCGNSKCNTVPACCSSRLKAVPPGVLQLNALVETAFSLFSTLCRSRRLKPVDRAKRSLLCPCTLHLHGSLLLGVSLSIMLLAQ